MEEDWEEWDASMPFWIHCVAGAMAGLMEHVMTFPLDTLKTHLQVSTRRTVDLSTGPVRALLAEGGVRRLWRGTSAVVAGSVPAHVLYFAAYEKAKQQFGANAPGHHPVAAAVSGGIAVLMHDGVMTPLDVCKQRMQLGHFDSLRHTVTETLAAEGGAAFFRSLPATLVMNVPFGMVLVSVNESLKQSLGGGDRPSTGVVLVSSAIAGGVAGAITNPLDVVKTRLQTQHFECTLGPDGFCPPEAAENCSRRVEFESAAVMAGQKLRQVDPLPLTVEELAAASPGSGARAVRFTGVVSTLQHIWKADGAVGFARGLHMRLLVHIPAAAISWTTYETVKVALAERAGGSDAA